MKQYNLYVRNSHNLAAQAVKLGWSWPAFFFGPLWALAKRLWLHAFGIFAAVYGTIFLAFSLEDDNSALVLAPPVVTIALWLFFGAKGNAWRERNLHSRGYALVKGVSAESAESALAQLGKPNEH